VRTRCLRSRLDKPSAPAFIEDELKEDNEREKKTKGPVAVALAAHCRGRGPLPHFICTGRLCVVLVRSRTFQGNELVHDRW
jgi:hypothetical protein